MSAVQPVLLADIGGTHARFALTDAAGGGLLADSVKNYPVSGHDSLESVAAQYLRQMDVAPSQSVMAIAGHVGDDAVDVANNPWEIRVSTVRDALKLDRLRVVNDFVAQSRCLPLLQAGDVEALDDLPRPPVEPDRDRCFAMLGPGTGLGVGALLARHGRFASINSEGGHVDFAPGNAREVAILQHLWRDYPHVSSERLISGMGLANLYQALAAIDGVPARALEPEEITQAATEGDDKLCLSAIESLCAILGAVAGNVVLTLGAWDGVWLAGGLSPVLLPWLRQPGFRQRFEAKGRRRAIMREIPCSVITHPEAGLLGAAAIANDS